MVLFVEVDIGSQEKIETFELFMILGYTQMLKNEYVILYCIYNSDENRSIIKFKHTLP